VGFVAELIEAAPGLRLLVTSREALNLQAEWFHPVEGLSFPAADDEIAGVAQLARYDAVRLFDQHARRVRGDFALAREREQVLRLCRLVEGMPLAIELAASWLKTLSVEQVLSALERGLDILTTRDRAIPERHRSIRTVIEESWRLLSAHEQQILALLAVFRSGFSAAAAGAVAGATLPALAQLAEKSLLRSAPDGRFQMHELLRQFAAEMLAAGQGEAAARRQHSSYYLAALSVQPAGADEIGSEIENVRAAWHWAAEQRDMDALGQALEPLFNFYHQRSRYHEGQADFAHAATSVLSSAAPTPHPQLEQVGTRLRARQGAFCYFRGEYDAASTQLEYCLQSAQALGLDGEQAFALTILGQLSASRGDYAAARQRLLQSLAISRAAQDNGATATALEKLAEIISEQGEYQQAKQLALESLALSRGLGWPDGIALALDRLGFITFCLGEYQEAASYFRESLALFEQNEHQLGRALALGALGMVRWAQGGAAAGEAQTYYERSLAFFRAIGHQRHIT
jgi:predicted ATPase